MKKKSLTSGFLLSPCTSSGGSVQGIKLSFTLVFSGIMTGKRVPVSNKGSYFCLRNRCLKAQTETRICKIEWLEISHSTLLTAKRLLISAFRFVYENCVFIKMVAFTCRKKLWETFSAYPLFWVGLCDKRSLLVITGNGHTESSLDTLRF